MTAALATGVGDVGRGSAVTRQSLEELEARAFPARQQRTGLPAELRGPSTQHEEREIEAASEKDRWVKGHVGLS